MVRLLFFILILFAALNTPAKAQLTNEDKTLKVPGGNFKATIGTIQDAKTEKSTFKSLKNTKTLRVDKVIDGLSILMTDGTIVRLSSLDIPDFHIWRDAPYAEGAMALLEKILPKNTEVRLYRTRQRNKGRLNRMKHELAHLVTKKDDVWIQSLLLLNGLARVYTMPNASEMSDALLNAEDKARQNKRGLWADKSEYKVISADNAAQAMGNYAVIEGVVKKTASVRNNVYLNFGDNWRNDFTIMITSKMRKKLAQALINPLGLSGRKIRVRGSVREYNGPLIELEDATHMEVLPLQQPLQLQSQNDTPKVTP